MYGCEGMEHTRAFAAVSIPCPFKHIKLPSSVRIDADTSKAQGSLLSKGRAPVERTEIDTSGPSTVRGQCVAPDSAVQLRSAHQQAMRRLSPVSTDDQRYHAEAPCSEHTEGVGVHQSGGSGPKCHASTACAPMWVSSNLAGSIGPQDEVTTETPRLGSLKVPKKSKVFAVLQPANQDSHNSRPPHVTGSSDTHLKQAVLKITVMDRATCAPICGAGVLVAELSSFMKGKPRNTGSTKQTPSKTDSRGRVRCTVLSSRWCAASLCPVSSHTVFPL
jgi:hypothetical protein